MIGESGPDDASASLEVVLVFLANFHQADVDLKVATRSNSSDGQRRTKARAISPGPYLLFLSNRMACERPHNR